MKVEIKDLKRGDMVYDAHDRYKVYSDAQCVDGKWLVDVTSSGDYACLLYEGHELFDNPDLK